MKPEREVEHQRPKRHNHGKIVISCSPTLVTQDSYLSLARIPETRLGTSGTVYVARYRPAEFGGVFLAGCSSAQMKQWLLNS